MISPAIFKKATSEQKLQLWVQHGTGTYPWMTFIMDLCKYNSLKIKMPEFLLGISFEIKTDTWVEDCETCDKKTTKQDGEFIFHFMPHEFFKVYMRRLKKNE